MAADNMFATPAVLFLVFNRPDTTERVFQAIRAARPLRLYVAADGARASHPQEAALVRNVREIASRVDWECNLITLWRDENLGCKRAVSSALDWFFGQESEGIVLEDDCVPHPDFFRFCGELLERYRDDERIGLISGTSLVDLQSEGLSWGDEDYVFTRYPSVWGWASWARSWKDYDVGLSAWTQRREDVVALTHDRRLARINASLLDRVRDGHIDTWDYQVSLMLWSSSRLSIAPRFNLIDNVGFGPGATHTTNAGTALATRARATPSRRLRKPLQAPSHVMPNRAYQRYIEQLAKRSLFSRIGERLGLYGR